MVCATPYIQNEFGDPRFFLHFLILSFSTGSQSFKESVRGKFLGAKVLKKVEIVEKMMRACTTSILIANSIRAIFSRSKV